MRHPVKVSILELTQPHLLTNRMEFHAVLMPSPDSYEQLPRQGVVKSFAASVGGKRLAPRKQSKVTMLKDIA